MLDLNLYDQLRLESPNNTRCDKNTLRSMYNKEIKKETMGLWL